MIDVHTALDRRVSIRHRRDGVVVSLLNTATGDEIVVGLTPAEARQVAEALSKRRP